VVSHGAFPPPPKSVRIWVVGETTAGGQSAAAIQAAQAGAKPTHSWRVAMLVFTVSVAVGALVALTRLVQEQLGG
jgi:hypothetical protein